MVAFERPVSLRQIEASRRHKGLSSSQDAVPSSQHSPNLSTNASLGSPSTVHTSFCAARNPLRWRGNVALSFAALSTSRGPRLESKPLQFNGILLACFCRSSVN